MLKHPPRFVYSCLLLFTVSTCLKTLKLWVLTNVYLCIVFLLFQKSQIGAVEAPQMFIVCIVSTCQKSQNFGGAETHQVFESCTVSTCLSHGNAPPDLPKYARCCTFSRIGPNDICSTPKPENLFTALCIIYTLSH